MNKFATCLNCMDGRAQLPVINWIRENYDVEYVDMITEAGIDGLLTDTDNITDHIIDKINISTNIHGSIIIFIVGHSDCAGNPVDDDNHLDDIKKSVANIKAKYPNIQVIGLWLSAEWVITKTCEE